MKTTQPCHGAHGGRSFCYQTQMYFVFFLNFRAALTTIWETFVYEGYFPLSLVLVILEYDFNKIAVCIKI